VIEERKMSLEELAENKEEASRLPSKLSDVVKKINIPLEENSNVLALACQEGMPLSITKDSQKDIFKINKALKKLGVKNDFVLVPLKARDKVIGLILADNIFTAKPISKNQTKMLTMFANQAGLAIENSRLYEQTMMQAHTDSLSGLWNHGYFQYKLSQEIKHSKKDEYPLSILIIDIDYFKNYNDTLGHQAGDKAITEISAILKESSRKDDFTCRYGGEEFALILPKTAKKTARIIAKRIRTNIEKHEFKHQEILPSNSLTVSIGVATCPRDAIDKDEIITKADSALYEAKRGGRNKVCAYQDGMHIA